MACNCVLRALKGIRASRAENLYGMKDPREIYIIIGLLMLHGSCILSAFNELLTTLIKNKHIFQQNDEKIMLLNEVIKIS